MCPAEISVAAVTLADATCLALWRLVLRSGGLTLQRLPPADMLADLQHLADSDASLAAALQISGESSDVEWGRTVLHLPQLLVRHFGQAGSSAAEIDAQSATAANCSQAQLLALCHLVLRQRALEARFTAELEEQKTAALYHFAYGLSHELNNPLANIATRAGMMMRDEVHPQRVRMLEAIVNHAMRGCEMLGDLMLVARPPVLHKQLTRLDELIGRVLARAEPWAQPFQVTMRAELASPRTLCVDAAALTEALWAVLRNAIEAMPDGGEIVVRLSEQPADTCDTPAALCIEIADQGCGLSREALQHCFDPYYSGREAGRGLGLGLAKARRIVDLHGGQLTLANRPCGGCVARLVLPSA